MECGSCGAPLKDGAEFCGKCGARQEPPAANDGPRLADAPKGETPPVAGGPTPTQTPSYAPPPTAAFPPAVAMPTAPPAYAPAPPYAPVGAPGPYVPPTPPAPASGGGKCLVIGLVAIGALLLLVLLGVGGFFAYRAFASRGSGGGSTGTSTSTSSGSGREGDSASSDDGADGSADDVADADSTTDDGRDGDSSGLPDAEDQGEDQSAVAGDIFLQAMQLDGDISAAAGRVNAALGGKRPSSPVLEPELRELVSRAEGLQTQAEACTDYRAPMLADACGYHRARAQALVDGYLAWYAGRSYTAYFQAGHDAKYKGLGYDEGTGRLLPNGLQSRINQEFAN